jgi:hypothetical protein
MPHAHIVSLQLDGLRLTELGKLRKFKPAQIAQVGKRLGKESVHGHVHELYMKIASKGLNPNTLYVAKYVEFKGKPITEYNGFVNEINVGGDPNVSNKQIGPGIVAYFISREYGVIIMENFLLGRDPKKYSSKYLDDYLGMTGCPAPNSRFVRLTKEVLEKFYRFTEGYHGDLHGSNMQVIVHKATGRVENVYIFDYGAHTLFRNPFKLTQCKSLSSILEFMNAEFENNFAQTPKRNRYIQNGIKHIATNNEEIRRSNARLLPLVLGHEMHSHVTNKKNKSPLTPKAILNFITTVLKLK